jgi:hypothetical protein
MMSMLGCSRDDVVLVCYPFSDLSGSKVRPAVVVSVPHAKLATTDAQRIENSLCGWLGL